MKLAFKIDEAIFPPAGIYKGTTGVAKLASDIILILTGVAGILSFIFIIIGGIKIITAAGDEKKNGERSGHNYLCYYWASSYGLSFCNFKGRPIFLEIECADNLEHIVNNSAI